MAETVRRLRTLASWLLFGWATALLAKPRETADAVLGGAPVPPLPVVRVLGARSAVQQLVLLARPDRDLARIAVAVDLLHAASMGAAAVLWPEYRRAELTSAGVALGSAVLSGRIAAAAYRPSLWD